jgi:hypothetical protein
VQEENFLVSRKTMTESGKLDINKRLTNNQPHCQKMSSPEVKRKQCGGDIYYANIRA